MIVAAAIAIAAHYVELPWLHYLAKPAVTLLVVAFALWLPAADAGYRRWLVIGLLWSTLGDVLLMIPRDWFPYGLLAFLVA